MTQIKSYSTKTKGNMLNQFIQFCSSQHSSIHWLNSSIFPCCCSFVPHWWHHLICQLNNASSMQTICFLQTYHPDNLSSTSCPQMLIIIVRPKRFFLLLLQIPFPSSSSSFSPISSTSDITPVAAPLRYIISALHTVTSQLHRVTPTLHFLHPHYTLLQPR